MTNAGGQGASRTAQKSDIKERTTQPSLRQNSLRGNAKHRTPTGSGGRKRHVKTSHGCAGAGEQANCMLRDRNHTHGRRSPASVPLAVGTDCACRGEAARSIRLAGRLALALQGARGTDSRERRKLTAVGVKLRRPTSEPVSDQIGAWPNIAFRRCAQSPPATPGQIKETRRRAASLCEAENRLVERGASALETAVLSAQCQSSPGLDRAATPKGSRRAQLTELRRPRAATIAASK